MARPNIDSTELPSLLPRTHCVLIPRDPHVIYAYWNFSEQDAHSLLDQIQFKRGEYRFILRVYDVTFIKFNGNNANKSWDHDVGNTAKSWYIQVWHENADYCAELGLRSSNNHFIPFTRSNIVRTPPMSTSRRNDLILQDISLQNESKPYLKENIKERTLGLAQQRSNKKGQQEKQVTRSRTYQLSAQNIRDYYRNLFAKMSHKSRARLKAFSLQRLIKGIPRGIDWKKVRPIKTSPYSLKQVHAGASEKGFLEKKGAGQILLDSKAGGSESRIRSRNFFFEVWTELIVHGRTEADAKVSLNQQAVKLNPDGTFSLRYALPDGDIPLKFIAQSSDGVEERSINSRVEREKTAFSSKMLKGPHG